MFPVRVFSVIFSFHVPCVKFWVYTKKTVTYSRLGARLTSLPYSRLGARLTSLGDMMGRMRKTDVWVKGMGCRGCTCLADPQLPWPLEELEAGPCTFCWCTEHVGSRLQRIRSYDGRDHALCFVLFLLRNWVKLNMEVQTYSCCGSSVNDFRSSSHFLTVRR